MSMTSRSKPHAAHRYMGLLTIEATNSPGSLSEQKPAADTAQNDTGPTDYPRPAAPGEQPQHEHHQHEEEQPRREKKHGMPDSGRRTQEILHKRADQNRPSKEMSSTSKAGGMRIAQPAGKGVGL